MIRFKLILFLLACGLTAQGQNLLQAKYVRAIDSFRLKHIVDSISIDTAFSAASDRKLATAAAIKAYVDNHAGGGGAGTDLSFTGATSPVKLNSSTGTDVVFKDGTNVTLTQSGDTLTITAAGGSASPAGSNTQVQFNDGGVFGADTSLTWNKTTNVLTLGINADNGTIAFPDTSTTKALVTLDGQRYITQIGQPSISEASQFWGYQAGPSAPIAASFRSNWGFGYQAGASLVSGAEYNMFLGNSAGRLYAGSGDRITVLGNNTFQAATDGCADCTLIGRGVMLNTTAPGASNTIIGSASATGASFTGIRNTIVGSLAINSSGLAGADGTVAVGYGALAALTSGDNNVVIGLEAGNDITTNSGNVIIGRWAANNGYNAATSIFIGNEAARNETTGNRLYVENSNSASPLIGGNFATDDVGINTTVANLAATLHVTGSGATSSTYSLIVTNSSAATATATLVVRDDQKVSIGTNAPDASSVLDVTSTTAGFLPPRMTTTQRDAISTPAAGLIIFNTTTSKHQGYDGSVWNDFY